MVKYSCDKCGKEFSQKSHYTQHCNKKLPCINEHKFKELIDKAIETKIEKIVEDKIEEVALKQTIKIKIKKKKTKLDPLVPIFKWSGGKKDEINKFIHYIPNDINIYLEPFIGGGSVFFHLRPNKSVISDVHSELIDFYKSIKDNKISDIYDFMKDNKNTEDNYYKIRDDMEIKTSLDNAKRFFYLRKTCYRGMLRYNKNGKFNIPFGRYKTYNYDILLDKNYEKILKTTEIYNKGFEYIFKNYNDNKNFMFLDPPYDSEFTDYGYCSFGKKEHKKLAKYFKKTKIRCLMIIGKTKFIKNLYKDYIVDEYDKKYRFKLHSNRIGDEIDNKHLIIKNY